MAARRAPVGLSIGGRALWRKVTADHALDVVQEVTLEEACRAKDRLDKLDEVLRGDVDLWVDLVEKSELAGAEIRIDQALSAANATANLMKQLLAALRLPDEATGKKPQQRGGARGAYKPAAATARVTAIDRAKARAGA